MVVFGKNILENLTTGMYSDSRVMYREYVQNSCDAIDTAVNAGIIKPADSCVDISIDTTKRMIRIRDNGCGVCKKDFMRVLSDLANSDKKRAIDKGFRGIGRLCGLAYCNELQFISTAIGEPKASVMTWDALKMRTMLNDDRKHTADEVLDAIMTKSEQSAELDDHFFEVVMTEVTSQDLLNVDNIRDYLSFEIPAPYPTKFMFYNLIYKHAQSLGVRIDEYGIYVNDEQLFKGYTTRIYSVGGKKHDEIKGIRFRDFYGENDELIAWAWFGLSSLNGQIKAQGNPQRGLRLRKGNIQIGDSGTLRRFFKDARGNEYFIGEIFAVHHHLIPNARRDYFNENAIRDLFEKQLRGFFEFLWKLCNVASDERSAYKAIHEFYDFEKEYEKKEQSGFSGGVDREAMQTTFEEKRQRAEKAQKALQKSEKTTDDEITTCVKEIVRTVETKDNSVKEFLKPLSNIQVEAVGQKGAKKTKHAYITDELSQYQKETRRVVGRIYDLINQHASDIAQELITKIHAGLKARKE
ncbi:MAG: ATP-binding protein [Betaproteobacteria bacterium]|nr:ATP-binding protein [Betaproteobacteria bacterium]